VAFEWSRVVVVTAQDLPGANALSPTAADQPVLVATVFRHRDEPVVLIAAPDTATLYQALDAVRLITEPWPPVLDIDATLAGEGPVYGTDNLLRDLTITRGDVALAMRRAAMVIERTYTTGAQEHVYLEPQGMQAVWDGDQVTVCGSMQCPYYVVDGLAHVFGLSPAQIRVQQCVTGGAFGGKEEYPTLLAVHTALLARQAGRPVRMVYARQEDMRCITKRHPARVRHRTAFTADGHVLGMDIDIVLDGGAYTTLSDLVLLRAALHATGPYQCEHLAIRARTVATNHPPRGAFRGFGAPQTLFAVEAHWEYCAARLGIDAVELRRKNLLAPGDTMATGQRLGTDVTIAEVLQRAITASHFPERRAMFTQWNRDAALRSDAASALRRGIGLAVFMHGAGFSGNGEAVLQAEVTLRGNPDGTVSVLTAQCDFGQGTQTILAQAAAAGLGMPMEWVIAGRPDTSMVLNSGPTVASRTAMIVGSLVLTAGQRLRHLVEQRAGGPCADAQAWRAAMAHLAAEQPLTVSLCYQAPPDVHWDATICQGDAYPTYAWGCCVVALEVDTQTGAVTILDVTAVQEAGQLINPLLATGQVTGGVAQGLGWAMSERVVWDKGSMHNASLTDYKIPTALDTPPIQVIFLERPYAGAPHGAKDSENFLLKG
jgi:CO/xanthine dehydrogenase Mo-binding subunit